MRRAVGCYQRGDLAGADRACQELLAARPDESAALDLAGMVALRAGRAAEASERLARAAALQPSSPKILNNLGASYMQQFRFAEALAAYERALALDPKNVATRVNIMSACKALADYERAIAQCREAMALGGETLDLLIELANLYALAHNYAAAIRTYRRSLAKAPGHLLAERGLAYALESAGRGEEAIEAYRTVAAHHPEDAEAQACLGLALAKSRQPNAAIAALRKAVALDPADVSSRVALGRLIQDRVPRWHFIMLGDEHRNAAYDAAIRRAVKPGDVVLDIGTGSGLLAMMAARAGAGHVYACEVEPVIAEKARDIIERNGLAERIAVIPKSSLDLRVGPDLPRKADVLVSEIVDEELLGEGIVRTLDHALAELAGPDSVVIPRGGAIHAMLVECEALYRRNRVERAAGFDVNGFNEFSRDSYFAENLGGFAHRNLSGPAEVFHFDFTRRGLCPERRTLEFPIIERGTCHALVSWFDLVLDDQHTVGSSPLGKGSHWGQAIYLLPEPRAVTKGDRMRFIARHDCKHVFFLPAAD